MPPFGFGLSIANLRGGGAAGPFVPVVLVQENWVGSGNVQNRTPSPISGGGFWRVTLGDSPISFDSSLARADQYATGTFRHSVTLTDASIIAVLLPSYTGSGNAFVAAWARSTPGPFTYPTSGYSVKCYDAASGSTPITLSKLVSGVTTVLGTSATDPTNSTITFTVAGSSLTVKVNGTTVIQVTDASIATAGYWGYELESTADCAGEAVAYVGPITVQTAQAGGVTDGILLENGIDFLLLENGDFLLQG